MTPRQWPAIVSQRRAVIDTRTAEGQTCTLIAVRHQEGPLGLYYHGSWRSSAMLPPPIYDELIAALTRLAD